MRKPSWSWQAKEARPAVEIFFTFLGNVGLEVAAEIASAYPSKNVSLVIPTEQLVERAKYGPPFSYSASFLFRK